MTQLEAVIFDLDGVITDTAEYHFLAWRQLGKELGIEIDRKFNEQLKGVGRMESLEKILAYGNRQNDFTQAEKIFYANKKNDHYKELIKQITPKDLLPGIKNLLNDIKEAGFKIGLASASKNAFAVIESLQVGDYFNTIVDAATVKNSKPDPEVFLKAADQLNVPYAACVGIEDAKAGVIAIKNAGMFAVGIGSETELEMADIVFPSTKHLNFRKHADGSLASHFA